MNNLLNDEEYLNYKFISTMKKIDNKKTKEILEILKILEELDIVYEIMKKFHIANMGSEQYKNYKNSIIKEAIEQKFLDINFNKDNIELLKSLLDELKYCKKRYYEYNKIFNIEILKIENMIL